jgi:SAM-dependent methyltransferase
MTNQSKPANPWLATRTRTGQEYDAPYDARAALGINVHGEADLVTKLLHASGLDPAPDQPYCVLDAGCGTGRMGIELARRGVAVVGVDLDEVMLAQARAKAPQLDWRLGDLATIEVGQRFDCIVLAGNVMLYLTPGTEAATLANMAGHLKPGGMLVAAFELQPPAWSSLTLHEYDRLAAGAGLSLIERWATWQQDPWRPNDQYAVSVHRKERH